MSLPNTKYVNKEAVNRILMITTVFFQTISRRACSSLRTLQTA